MPNVRSDFRIWWWWDDDLPFPVVALISDEIMISFRIETCGSGVFGSTSVETLAFPSDFNTLFFEAELGGAIGLFAGHLFSILNLR